MSETAADELRGAPPNTIHALTGIRAVAAAWVVLEHYRGALYSLVPVTRQVDWWIDSGYLGVEVFFVLSGFIICYNYADAFAAGATRYRGFLVNRFARIYPVHLVTLLAVAGLVAGASFAGVTLNSSDRYTTWSFVANLLLLQAAPESPAWNGPSWSISAEALAYATFPLTAMLLARLTRPRSAALSATAWLTVGTSAMMVVRTLNPEPTSPGMALLRIATEFVAGAMLWKAWSTAGEPRSNRWDAVAMAAFAGTVLGLALLPRHEALPLVLTPLIAVFVIGCAASQGAVNRVLSTRPMIFGGKISYSLYMVHFVLLAAFVKVLPWERFETAGLVIRLAVMSFYLAACVAAAALCYFGIEEPARRRIQRWAKTHRVT